VCVSSGNEGEDPVYIYKQFSAGSTEVKTFIPLTNGTYSGRFQVWGRNSTVFPLQVVVYDTTDSKIVYSYNLNRNLGGGRYGIGSSAYSNYSDIDVTPAEFDAAMTGYVMMWSNIATTNSRYNVELQFNCTPKDSRYVMGLVCSGTAGSIVEFYSGTGFTSRGISGWTNGTPDNSANDLACGDNVLAIGSYTSRNSWPNYGGALMWLASNQTYAETHYPVGKISPFTSYGQEINGKNIPTICAPGCYLVSSISTPYFNKAGLVNASVVGVAESTIANTETTRQNYWDGMMGTSMASPFAAGVCALMLQADPTLTYDKVRDILTSTAIRDDDVTSATNQVQWGAGKIDAYAAVKKVLAQSSAIGAVSADESRWTVLPATDGYDVVAPGAESIEASLYDVQGRCVTTAAARGCELRLTTASLPAGIYILRASSSSSSHTSKLLIR
ncbi:MAG: S8 family serine peptidase, partial [Paramuribaculum sp.]|nr:S8 family serine peptidase [Paramuribaculum sp.]